MKHARIGWVFGLTLSVLTVGAANSARAEGAGDDVFDEIMKWTQEEVRDAGQRKTDTSGEAHSRIFVGDNKRYDVGRGEVRRNSFIEGELFKGSNIALSPEMAKEVIEEIKLKTKPEDWYAHINSAKKAIGKQSLDNWYQELAECKTVCAQIVVRMMAKHFEAIAKLPHFFVMFNIGSDAIDSSYNGFLEQIGDYLARDPLLNVLIIGRASQIGDRAYNRELSRKRSDSIKFKLMERNVAPDRLKVVYLGYEPPQISRNITNLYQLDSPLINLNHPIKGKDMYQINQSAVVSLISN